MNTHPGIKLITAISLLTYGCGGGAADTSKTKSNDPVAVQGFVVKAKNADNTIQLPGQLLAMDEVDLMPEIAGRIVQLNLPEGESVRKGTLLVKLFDDDLQAQLKKLQEQLKTATSTRDRQKELLKANGISQLEFDQSESTVNTLQDDIDDMNAKIARTEIRAPFDGTIGLKKVSIGAYVSAGTSIATLRAEEKMKIDFTVPEIYASLISKGNMVTFHLDQDTADHTAEILATERGVNDQSLDYRVRAIILGSSNRFIPGSSATVDFSLSKNDSAIIIPSQALIAKANSYTVFISQNGKAVSIPVTIGLRTASDVQIVSGVHAGDTLATTGLQFIRKGSALRFTSVN